jgi:hypothetical protein
MSQDQGTRDKGNPINRRVFFGATLGAAGTAALVAGGARPVVAQQRGAERTRARYQVTEHVEAYYRTNRYYPRED